MQKFAKRHKALCGAVAAVLIVLSAATVVSTAMYLRATEQRDRATALNEFFKDTLAGANTPDERGARPDATPMDELSARELLERAAANVAARFKGQPELESDIRGTLSRAFLTIGCRAECKQQAQLAFDLRTAALGPEHPKTLQARRWLVEGFTNEGQCGQILDFARATYEADLRYLGPNDCETAKAGRMLGDALRGADRLAESEQLLRGLAETQRRVRCDYPAELGNVLSELGWALEAEGALADAESQAREFIRLWENTSARPEARRCVALGQWQLGCILQQQGRLAEAEPLMRACLAEYRRVYGEDHALVRQVAGYLAQLQAELEKLAETKTGLSAVPETPADVAPQRDKLP